MIDDYEPSDIRFAEDDEPELEECRRKPKKPKREIPPPEGWKPFGVEW